MVNITTALDINYSLIGYDITVDKIYVLAQLNNVTNSHLVKAEADDLFANYKLLACSYNSTSLQVDCANKAISLANCISGMNPAPVKLGLYNMMVILSDQRNLQLIDAFIATDSSDLSKGQNYMLNLDLSTQACERIPEIVKNRKSENDLKKEKVDAFPTFSYRKMKNNMFSKLNDFVIVCMNDNTDKFYGYSISNKQYSSIEKPLTTLDKIVDYHILYEEIVVLGYDNKGAQFLFGLFMDIHSQTQASNKLNLYFTGNIITQEIKGPTHYTPLSFDVRRKKLSLYWIGIVNQNSPVIILYTYNKKSFGQSIGSRTEDENILTIKSNCIDVRCGSSEFTAVLSKSQLIIHQQNISNIFWKILISDLKQSDDEEIHKKAVKASDIVSGFNKWYQNKMSYIKEVFENKNQISKISKKVFRKKSKKSSAGPTFDGYFLKWFKTTQLFVVNASNIIIFDLNPRPFIQISNLSANTSLDLTYSINNEGQTYNQNLNFTVLPQNTEYLNVLPVANETLLLNKFASGYFIYSWPILKSWFLGNELSYSIACQNSTQGLNPQSAEATSIANVLRTEELNPRQFNLYTGSKSSKDVYHYNVLQNMVNNRFITVIQLAVDIYVNECLLTTLGVIRCNTKYKIPSTELIIDSILTSEYFAYKLQDGYHIRIFKNFEKEILFKPHGSKDIFCNEYVGNPQYLVCSETNGTQDLISYWQTNKDGTYPTLVSQIKGTYASKVYTSHIYEDTLFVIGDGQINIVHINGQLISVIKSKLTTNNIYYITLTKYHLVIINTLRNSFEEYYLGQLSNPKLVKPEFSLSKYNYQILDVHGYSVNREFTNMMPLIVRYTGIRNNSYVKLQYVNIGEAEFNTQDMSKSLYMFKRKSTYFLQSTLQPRKIGADNGIETGNSDNKSNKEIVSFINTGAVDKDLYQCGQMTDSKVIACDIIVYHQYSTIFDQTNLVDTSKLDCNQNISKNTAALETVPFIVDIGDTRKTITSVDGKTIQQNIQITASSNEIKLKGKFNGQIQNYSLDRRQMISSADGTGNTTNDKNNHNAILNNFDWQEEISKIMQLSREGMIIRDIKMLDGHTVFALTENTVIKLKIVNKVGDGNFDRDISGLKTNFQPYVSGFLNQASSTNQNITCERLLLDSSNQIIITVCNKIDDGYFMTLSTWYSRTPKILVDAPIEFNINTDIIDIFYTKNEVIVWGIEKETSRTIVQSYYLTFQGGAVSTPQLNLQIPKNYMVSNSPIDFVQMVKADGFGHESHYVKKTRTREYVWSSKTDIDKLYVCLYNGTYLSKNGWNFGLVDPKIRVYTIADSGSFVSVYHVFFLC